MFSRLSISQKIFAGFALMVAIIATLVTISYRGTARMEEATRWNVQTYQVIHVLNSSLEQLINIETGMRGFGISGQEDFLQPLKDGERRFKDNLDQLAALTRDNAAQQQRIAELQGLKDAWQVQDIQPILALRRALLPGTPPDATLTQRLAQAQDKAKMDRMRSVIAAMENAESALLGARGEALHEANRSQVATLVGGGLLAAILALALALGLARNTRARLQLAIDAANTVAEGRLDTVIDTRGNDELPRAFDRMQRSLREMVQQIAAAAQQLVRSVEQITGSAQQLTGAATEQSTAASSMAATIEQLSVSISHVAGSAQEAHRLANHSGQQSMDGSDVIQATLASMTSIADTVQTCSVQISELGQHSDQTSSIVNVIQSIADQTNLLALNAAIEAARAGDQGRGFAVVADEVRLLAQRTGTSTQEIAAMIEKIQTGVRETVDNMKVGVAVVEHGVAQAARAGDAIVGIREGSSQVMQVVDQISFALREQNAASQDVARNVEQSAQMSARNRSDVQHILQATTGLTELSQGLQREVARFSL